MSLNKISIYRGIPGSGKNTHAEEEGFDRILDSDTFFHMIGETNEYTWKEERHHEAHQWCFRQYLQSLYDDNLHSLAVCNTHLRCEEFTPYTLAGKSLCPSADLRLVRMVCSPETGAERNTHGVPLEKVKGMADRMEDPRGHHPTEMIIRTE